MIPVCLLFPPALEPGHGNSPSSAQLPCTQPRSLRLPLQWGSGGPLGWEAVGCERQMHIVALPSNELTSASMPVLGGCPDDEAANFSRLPGCTQGMLTGPVISWGDSQGSTQRAGGLAMPHCRAALSHPWSHPLPCQCTGWEILSTQSHL